MNEGSSLLSTQRLVVKVGSALLVDQASGAIHHQWLKHFIADIADLCEQGKQVIIVTSGSIAIGRHYLAYGQQKLSLEKQQACAAVGQIHLAHAYQTALAEHQIKVAQVLLTFYDTENRQRYLNASNTLDNLLRANVVPIINENDTVATAEIRYGDNDRLAARVAQMTQADTLILLSDIDGLYTADPRKHKDVQFIPEVRELTPEIMAMGGNSTTHYGSGGMKTKLVAAKIAMNSGCRMVITQGHVLNPLKEVANGGLCTWFLPITNPQTARKNWLAQHLQPLGKIIIDQGAINALHDGKSLLAIGVKDVVGHFQKGDAVNIVSQSQEEIARGLSNYSAEEVRKIKGKHSDLIEEVLGYCGSEEIIHRNDLVLTQQ